MIPLAVRARLFPFCAAVLAVLARVVLQTHCSSEIRLYASCVATGDYNVEPDSPKLRPLLSALRDGLAAARPAPPFSSWIMSSSVRNW